MSKLWPCKEIRRIHSAKKGRDGGRKCVFISGTCGHRAVPQFALPFSGVLQGGFFSMKKPLGDWGAANGNCGSSALTNAVGCLRKGFADEKSIRFDLPQFSAPIHGLCCLDTRGFA